LASCEKNGETPENFPNLSIDSLNLFQTNIPGGLYTDLTFINEAIGFAISNFGMIIKTMNGGHNWNNYHLQLISFSVKSNSPIVRLVISLVAIIREAIF